MIQTFKKGSYRIFIATVLFTTTLSVAVSLPSASGSSLSVAGVNTPIKSNDKLIPEPEFINYNRLDRVVKQAGFTFEVPSVLPPGFYFNEGTLVKSKGSAAFDRVALTFKANSGKYQQQQFVLEAGKFKGAENMTDTIKENIKELYGSSKFEIEEKDLTIKGLNFHRINVTIQGVVKDSSYLWERGGVSYRLNSRTVALLEQELAVLIASLKLPDDKMKSTYINKDLLAVDVVDGEDLKLAASAIGFTPKLPLKVSDYKLNGALVTKKLNFSAPRNAKDALTRVLVSSYENPVSYDGKNPQWFKLLQIKDDGQYATFKANKQVVFYEAPGEQNKVSASLVTIAGKEVLRTAPYPVAMFGTEAVAYFWVDSGVCYQAVFKKDQVKDPQTVVAALIKTPPVQFKK
ncbi:hypothetical protein [Paenibacillus agri]|uniref:DUF4367 domain-containing protein n=1 Tax=Paenibacillus agri TaxID=2744309 RepID=A0A850EN66_9BACL|nr:hypothetical protein [Paenibacillus agri]NUU60977.1 hypothetical protein [Paenibacillus agri]